VERLSLYDLLIGYFPSEGVEPTEVDGSYFDRLSEEKKWRLSIVENLKKILQSRQGSVEHLPDFGLPDIFQMYIESGYSFDTLIKKIRDTILKYEPRIASVKVEEPHFDKDNMNISLRILATLKDIKHTEILLTEFSSTGWSKVIFERDES
jgi:type VI secretion system protein